LVVFDGPLEPVAAANALQLKGDGQEIAMDVGGADSSGADGRLPGARKRLTPTLFRQGKMRRTRT